MELMEVERDVLELITNDLLELEETLRYIESLYPLDDILAEAAEKLSRINLNLNRILE